MKQDGGEGAGDPRCQISKRNHGWRLKVWNIAVSRHDIIHVHSSGGGGGGESHSLLSL